MAVHGLLPKGESIGRRFQSLAEKRRRHLLELYETGRWRHYFSEDQLALEIHETGRLIDGWKKIAEEQLDTNEVDVAGIAPHEPQDPSIQPDAESVEQNALSDRPIALLHD